MSRQAFRRRIAAELESHGYQDNEVYGSMNGDLLVLHCFTTRIRYFSRRPRSFVSLWCRLKGDELRCVMMRGIVHPLQILLTLPVSLVLALLLRTSGAALFLTWAGLSALLLFIPWVFTRMDENLYDYESALLGAANQLCKEEEE